MATIPPEIVARANIDDPDRRLRREGALGVQAQSKSGGAKRTLHHETASIEGGKGHKDAPIVGSLRFFLRGDARSVGANAVPEAGSDQKRRIGRQVDRIDESKCCEI
jgi:hypothetical protein